MPVYAEDVNYWKTGDRTPPESWVEKAKDEIRDVGGVVIGSVMMDGAPATFGLIFMLGGENHRINWPVLPLDPTKRRTDAQWKTDLRAARVQAATFLHHDVKARCMVAKVMGGEAAFLQFRVLPDGSTIAEQGFRGEKIAMPEQMLLIGGGK